MERRRRHNHKSTNPTDNTTNSSLSPTGSRGRPQPSSRRLPIQPSNPTFKVFEPNLRVIAVDPNPQPIAIIK
ncbi:hypothetical protein FF1_023879 [Malus domestica]